MSLGPLACALIYMYNIYQMLLSKATYSNEYIHQNCNARCTFRFQSLAKGHFDVHTRGIKPAIIR